MNSADQVNVTRDTIIQDKEQLIFYKKSRELAVKHYSEFIASKGWGESIQVGVEKLLFAKNSNSENDKAFIGVVIHVYTDADMDWFNKTSYYFYNSSYVDWGESKVGKPNFLMYINDNHENNTTMKKDGPVTVYWICESKE